MAWDAVIVTLRCSNDPGFSPYVDVSLDCLAAVPVEVQDESGEREAGAGGVLSQNQATRGEIPLVVRKMSIGSDAWDYGDYQKATKYFRAKYIRIQSVTGSAAALHKGTEPDGDPYAYWSAGLPRNVIVEYDTATLERRGGLARLDWAVTLRDALPQVGVSIT